MDDDALYDEFGNYIGPELDDSDSDSLVLPNLPASVTSPQKPHEQDVQSSAHQLVAVEQDAPESPQNQIVLAEEKEYYPSAEDAFGAGREVLVEEEDAQPITEPIIAPVVESSSGLHETEHSIPPSKYDLAYFSSVVLPSPYLNRNIALIGSLHHGKTSFVDMLFEATHHMPWDDLDDRQIPVRYTDMRLDEQQLHVSLKTTAASFLLTTHRDKSYAFNLLDTPGHANFSDEAIAAMNLVDGVVIFVDVAEGVTMSTEILLQRAATMRLDIVLVISKLDRLCLELRLPPSDAYHKIRNIVDSVNDVIEPLGVPSLSPGEGNVAFSSAREGICFTLPQFANAYIDANGGAERFPINALQLAKRFWGNYYYNRKTRRFSDKSVGLSSRRTFVEFVLEPIYKLHTIVVSEDEKGVTEFLKRNNLFSRSNRTSSRPQLGSVNPSKLKSDVKGLLKEVTSKAFGMGSLTGFTDMIADFIKSPAEAAERKVETMSLRQNTRSRYDEGGSFEWYRAMKECQIERSSPMTAYIGKLVPDEKGMQFDCLLRVLSGELRKGDEVRILGDEFDIDSNDEDQAVANVEAIYVPCGRFRIATEAASAGQIVLVRGIDRTVMKSATVVSIDHPACNSASILRPLTEHLSPGVLKVAIEPMKPSELPKMVSSLRQCVKSFPGLATKVEASGEHAVIGSGELYMDCVLRDIREAFGKIRVKVSDPVVPFAETVSETSALQCYAETPNGQNKIVMVAEPLEEEVLTALENGSLEKSGNSPKALRQCGWDTLAAQSLWTFGPNVVRGPNALLNDVLIQETRRKADDVRESIVQGFSWAVREGPLADEPVRAVKIRLLDTEVAESIIARSPAQIIPTSRRVAYSAILTANPRLMEPVYKVEIRCSQESVSTVYMLIGRRRGIVLSETSVAGTALTCIMANMPCLDSFGFEPDLRSLTNGAAFCTSVFDHWAIMPGDPLDKSVKLGILEPAGRRELARECMIKTRRRKGMPDDVSLTKYFDDPLLVELAADNEELQGLL